MLDRIAMLVQPHAPEAGRGAGEQRRVAVLLGGLDGTPEQLARVGEEAAHEHHLGVLDRQRCPTLLPG